jgi:hypothetical protein
MSEDYHMPITLLCPGCKTRLTVGDDRAGTTFNCPKCSTAISVPVVVPAPAPSPVAVDFEDGMSPPSPAPAPPGPEPSPRPRPTPEPDGEDEPPPGYRPRRRRRKKAGVGLWIVFGVCAVVTAAVLVVGVGYWTGRNPIAVARWPFDGVSPSARADLEQWFAATCPHARIVRIEYMPVRGTRGKVLGELLEESFGGPNATPTKPKPPSRIDGAYRVTLRWNIGGESGTEQWCALRKEGGGIDFAWELRPGDDWQQKVADVMAGLR